MRTGILGGTFNPIHYGHLRPAEEVREALGLEQVRFIPLADPAHKSPNDIAPPRDRLEMVRLALEGHPFFMCDPLEIERGGISYTVDTIEALAGGPCREHELFFIIGADAFSLLHTWREPIRLLGMTNFAITLRGEQEAGRVIKEVETRLKESNGGIEFMKVSENSYKAVDIDKVINFVPVATLDISATHIRELCRSQGVLRNLLPPPVEAFIIRRDLYGGKGQASAR